MFPDNYRNETQVIIYVISSDKENPADVLGGIGASAALSISEIPFNGPIASVRVGKIDDQLVLNPTLPQLEESQINLIVSGTYDSIMMVEGQSEEISETEMLEALRFGHQAIREIIELQQELIREIPVQKWEMPEAEQVEGLDEKVEAFALPKIKEAIQIQEKKTRREAISQVRDAVMEHLGEDYAEQGAQVKAIMEKIEKREVRAMILNQGVRLDGRGMDNIRDITCEVSFLPRAHGSALFTRGQTQSLGSTTLGTKNDEQIIDALEGESKKSYMLHYNFPGFSVGEVKPFRGTSRREVGHGDLAERALMPVLPVDESFPYTIRIVSEILGSMAPPRWQRSAPALSA